MKQMIRRMGLSVGLAGVIAATLTVLGFVANGRVLLAQNGSHITVLRELEHDTSPPLDKIPPLPPEAGPKSEVPFHPTHGRFAPPPEAQADQIIQSSPTTTATPSSDHNYLGLGTGFSGFSVQYIPPDTNGAVGDTQFVQWVNASFAVIDKATGDATYGPAAGNTLWSGFGGACERNNSGDPIAQYDELASRWVLMQPVFKSPYYVCVAVSTTPDATGDYYRYAFQVPNRLFPDYPKLGIWSDGYYLTYNQFGGNSFQGAAACALDRANMLVGNPATMQCTTVNPAYGSLLPADFDGKQTSSPPAGSPGYFLNFGGDHQSLDLWQFHVDWNNPNNSTFSGPAIIGVAAFSEACGGADCIPQKGTSQTLDSLGDRLMYRLAYRNLESHESMVVSHSVDTGNGYTGVRWYELTQSSPGAGWGVAQQRTYAPSTDYRWMPSIAMDKNGNIAMGYSVSSSTMSPTIAYTGRAPGDTAGQMGSEVDLLNGITHGSQTSYARWGDYASMAIDPVDDCTFWFTTEYQPTNGVAWSTRIASFKFSDCSGSTALALSSVSLSSMSVVGGNSLTGTVTLTAAAPAGGVTVDLSSSNTSVATVPSTVTVAAGATSVGFTVTTSAVGTSTPVTITASYNGVDKTASLTVNPPAAGDFTLSVSPGNVTLKGAGTASYNVTVTSSGGYSGTVNLAVSNIGDVPGASASTASVPGGSGSATLTVTTSSSTPRGNYTLTLMGTDGSLSNSVNVGLKVR